MKHVKAVHPSRYVNRGVAGQGGPGVRTTPASTRTTFISSVMSFNDRFEHAVQQLKKLAKLDADKCIAEGKLLFCNDVYKNPNIASSLQCVVSTMVTG